jgi:hypothetical protein
MKNVNLYNQDGSLCSEAQFLLSFKPDDMSRGEWIKLVRKFKFSLSAEDLKEFERLKTCVRNAKWRAENPDYNAAWNAENPDYNAAWNAENPKKVKAHSAKQRAENPEKVKVRNAKWRAENPDYCDAWRAENPDYGAKWRAENPEKVKEHCKRSQRKQRSRPENKLRSAVSMAFKRIGQNKPTDTITLLGCTWEEAKAHIESLFQEGMTWENHGRGDGKWQIDHIRPVASFKGASEEELKQMNHISNLQPLWSADNIRKGDKWDGKLNSEILNFEV